MDPDLKEYFNRVKGIGVLATADGTGRVDTAIYSRPHVLDKETVAFIMADRLTHHCLQSNGHAAYLFKEDGPGYRGLRLFLSKLREEKDSDLLYSLRSKRHGGGKEDDKPHFLVFFKVDKVIPLVGAGRDPEQD